MEKRYHMFSNTGTKKIEGYNEYVEKWNKAHPDEQPEKMPHIKNRLKALMSHQKTERQNFCGR